MPGGLLQLIGRGAQDQLITGNPSFTQFRSVYKRHTDFAMESFRLYFKTTILSFPTSGTLTLRTKVERYAQLVSDCYLSITLPDIYSPVAPISPLSRSVYISGNGTTSTAIVSAGEDMVAGEIIDIVSTNYNGRYTVLMGDSKISFTFASNVVSGTFDVSFDGVNKFATSFEVSGGETFTVPIHIANLSPLTVYYIVESSEVSDQIYFGVSTTLDGNNILAPNAAGVVFPNTTTCTYVESGTATFDAPPGFNVDSTAVPYEFAWVRNIGYNMINHVSLLINGQELVRHTGEWMKIYANLQFDANKRSIIDRMVGNLPELYDPTNANGRINQYPSAISTSSDLAQPSIPGRVLQIPLHFWFCEDIGKALPLVALQYSEVEIIVELNNVYQLFTTIDVNQNSETYGNRVAPDSSNTLFQLSNFLSPPKYDTTPSVSLTTWNLNPYIEANYIFVSDEEMGYLARTDHSFLIKQVDMVSRGKQYGPSNDLELTMRNLCTRIIWLFQRDDIRNDPDNYTNWLNSQRAPIMTSDTYSSGTTLASNVSQRDILLESSVILDTQERFATKQTEYFRDIQPYRFSQGNPIPGVYSYSFQLDNSGQPSGSLNGSMFNKTILRNTLIQPPFADVAGNVATTVCILKSTASSANPVVVNPNLMVNTTINGVITSIPAYTPDQIVTIITKSPNTTVYTYTYNVTAYTESYNFLRIVGGIGNVVFSS
jgi:hypothetical protein